ncbi:MAG: RnfH family protein [Betaproteobacteria bacterium]|nr:RnfH family protein [Betaproteobacteria bacterium]
MTAFIDIEVAYAPLQKDKQILKQLRVPTGATVEQAIKLSKLIDEFPEIDLLKNKIGIFSKFTQRDTILQSMDRVEIYRPLKIDPKEARRIRAKTKKTDNNN